MKNAPAYVITLETVSVEGLAPYDRWVVRKNGGFVFGSLSKRKAKAWVTDQSVIARAFKR